jgi:hypothetical protein
MDTENKVLLGLAGVALVGVAVAVGLEVRRSNKQIEEIKEMARKRIGEIRDQSVAHRIAHEKRMAELHAEDELMQKRHKKVMAALKMMHEEDIQMSVVASNILTDLAKGIITPAVAAKLLRENAGKRPNRRRKVAVAA